MIPPRADEGQSRVRRLVAARARRAGASRQPAHARASLRQVCMSTAASGIAMRKVAPMVPSTRWMSPPWARTSSAAMARPSPLPPMRGGDWNARNRVARGLVGRAALERLHGVAREVEQGAQELVVVGVDHQSAFDRGDPADARVGRKAVGLADLLAPGL